MNTGPESIAQPGRSSNGTAPESVRLRGQARFSNAFEQPEAGMHICFVVSGDLWAGAACQVTNLLSELIRERRYRFSAVTFNPGRLTAELTDLGIPVLCLPEERMSSFEILIRVRRHIKKQRVDIIHAHGHKEHILSCMARLAARRPVKVIRTLHGMPEPYHGIAGLRVQFYQKLMDFCSAFLTHKIIVVSHDMERRLQATSWARKLVCIHNGVNFERLRVTMPPAQMRDALKVAQDEFVIGAACRLVPIKRLDILIKAFEIAHRTYPNAILLICGDGPLRESLKKQCETLNVKERVRFLGHREDVHDVMSIFNLFVMTSDHEGIPMVLLEALALGIQIVAPAVGGIPEVVNGQGAVLLNPLTEAGLAEQFAKEIEKTHSAMATSAKRQHTDVITAKQTAKETAFVYDQCKRCVQP